MALIPSLILFFSALLGAALNAVAGGGSFITFPSLIFSGIAPVTANATSTVILWPAAVASVVAYRSELRLPRRQLLTLGAISLAGGFIGALLLLKTSNSTFMKMTPWLLLGATLIFSFGSRLTRRLQMKSAREGAALTFATGALVQLAISIYGGYFGGGMGILLLATLSLLGMSNIHEMNGLKMLLISLTNGVAVFTFILARAVSWRAALVMVVGAICGGYFGAAGARRIDPRRVKLFAMMVAWAMTLYFFRKIYLV